MNNQNQNLKVMARYVPTHEDAIRRIDNILHKDFTEEELDFLSRAPKRMPLPTHRITALGAYNPVDPSSFEEKCVLYKGTMDGLYFEELVRYRFEERLNENWVLATIYHTDRVGRPLTFVGTILWINEPVPDPTVPNSIITYRGTAYGSKLPLLQGVAHQMLTKVCPPPKGKKWVKSHKEGGCTIPGHYE